MKELDDAITQLAVAVDQRAHRAALERLLSAVLQELGQPKPDVAAGLAYVRGWNQGRENLKDQILGLLQ